MIHSNPASASGRSSRGETVAQGSTRCAAAKGMSSGNASWMGDGPLDFEDRDLQLSKAGDYWRPLNKTWSEVEQMARDADGGEVNISVRSAAPWTADEKLWLRHTRAFANPTRPGPLGQG